MGTGRAGSLSGQFPTRVLAVLDGRELLDVGRDLDLMGDDADRIAGIPPGGGSHGRP